jgi:prophage regulatory protein
LRRLRANQHDNGEIKMTQKQLIDKKKLREIVPLSDRTIDELEKKGRFPKRFALTSNRVVWDMDDVVEWIEKQKSAAHQSARTGLMPA